MDLIFFAIVIFVAYLVYDILRDCNAAGPFKYPLLGNFPQLVAHANDNLDYFGSLFQQYGRVVFLRIFTQRVHLLGDRADVEYIMKTKWKNFTVAHRRASFHDLVGDGIVTTDGALWEEQRKTSAKEFTANRFRFLMGDVFAQNTVKLSTLLGERVPRRTSFDIASYFFQYTMDSFGKIATGVDLKELDGVPHSFGPAVDRAMQIAFNRQQGSHPVVWRTQQVLNLGSEAEMKKIISVVDEFVHSLIKDRRAMSKEALEARDDLMSRLMSISDAGDVRDDKYLRDMLLVFVIAGRDSTAAGLSWFIYNLSQRPDVEKRLVEELHTQLGGTTPNWDNLKGCHYLQACLSETLRLHPSFPMGDRTAAADDVLPSGCRVRAGDMILMPWYCIGRDKELWGPDATSFRPERWLGKDGVYTRPEDPFQYVTFGGAGLRNCLGMDLAHFMAKVCLATLFQNYTFRLDASKGPVRYAPGVLKVDGGLWVTAEERDKKQ